MWKKKGIDKRELENVIASCLFHLGKNYVGMSALYNKNILLMFHLSIDIQKHMLILFGT